MIVPLKKADSCRSPWSNIEFAKRATAPPECLVVYETTHLRVRGQDEQFTNLVNTYLANRRAVRNEFNVAPLACEEW